MPLDAISEFSLKYLAFECSCLYKVFVSFD